ncbi:hypothetical protein [Prevotella sp.]|uniref:hypothetical protein n=1 Tax=Prevotella sp. TaxID=59823 RepID=UPI001CAAC54A|nr:hypothetical protein [Prevotella sp.]MBF1640466.1 hypothetical protein [Prevotella sp.]
MDKKNKHNLLVALFLLLVGSIAVSCSKDDDATTDNTSNFAPISSKEALKIQKSLLGKYRSNVYIYNPSTKKNYYSNSKLDLDTLTIYDERRFYYGDLSLSRNTYLQLHDLEKNRMKGTMTKISSQPDEKISLGLEGIRFTSRNRQDSCIYRFEVSRGVVDYRGPSLKTTVMSSLMTYFNGYGYYNVKTSKLKIYLLPYNSYAIPYYDTFQSVRLPLTGRYLVYELTKVQ